MKINLFVGVLFSIGAVGFGVAGSCPPITNCYNPGVAEQVKMLSAICESGSNIDSAAKCVKLADEILPKVGGGCWNQVNIAKTTCKGFLDKAPPVKKTSQPAI